MASISFYGIGREIITTKFSGALHKGDLCVFSTSDTVAPASSGGSFSGKVIDVYSDGTASVQIRGYIETKYQDSAALNAFDSVGLLCNNAGSVKKDNNGRKYLVVHYVPATQTVGIIL